MALATHLGPWLLGTVKNTTGTTAGTIRNVGYTLSVQQSAVAYNDTTATYEMTLPAGSLIFEAYIYQTGAQYTSGTSGTITLNVNGTAAAVATITGAGSAAPISLNPTSTAQSTLFTNVGTTDALISTTNATLTAGSGILVVVYGVRLSDGTYTPTAFTA